MFLAGFKLKESVVQLKRGSPRVQGSCARDISAFLLLLFVSFLFLLLLLFSLLNHLLNQFNE